MFTIEKLIIGFILLNVRLRAMHFVLLNKQGNFVSVYCKFQCTSYDVPGL
jgi:hypothetical protein